MLLKRYESEFRGQKENTGGELILKLGSVPKRNGNIKVFKLTFY